ncbi:MAG: DNA mismatch repair endonuclease MutL [Ignavibacteria bacterium]
MSDNKIKILPQSLSNKIAAGEVVNRPDSAVKELIENSIDAKADHITLIVRDAGKSLIQIIDNGQGMTEDDAVMSLQRHSTSKISSYEDIENILTLGFRGEALASISSVSQIELKTKTASEDVGVLLKAEGGEVTEISKTQCETGTSIAIRNLFYNTPGRRNFLKSDQTEFRHIYETFIRLAVSNPDTGFKFINNDEEVFDLKPSSLRERLINVFTNKMSESLIEVDYGNELIKIKGFISKPNFTKKSKQDQYFYLNNRFFVSKSLNFSVYTGYDDLIEKGDYPSFFLFIEIDPKKVDVNVHPSKMEVKFEDESAVFGFVRRAVKEALKKADLVFEVGFDSKLDLPDTQESFHYKQSGNTSGQKFSGSSNYQRRDFDIPKRENTSNIHSQYFEASRKPEEIEENDEFAIPQADEQKHIRAYKKI